MRKFLALAAALACVGGARAEDETVVASIGDEAKVVAQVPKTWVKQRPKNEMRKAQWGLPKAGGDERNPELFWGEFSRGGGAEANLKRWVGEYADTDAEPTKETFEADGVKVHMIEIVGTFQESVGGGGPFAGGRKELRKGFSTLAAFLEVPGVESVLTVKAVGPKASMAAQKASFVKMLKGLKKSA